MKEAIGNTFILNLVITFVFIFIMFFAGSISYTKAFKVKNKIIEILERNETIVNGDLGTNQINSPILLSIIETDINANLKEIGYRISSKTTCSTRGGAVVSKSTSSNYRYCITRHVTSRGAYYGVTTYMYFEIPIIGISVEFPIFGETKIMGVIG
ncbi:MAG: hypothetical protein ACK5HP_04900 [Bacilli bacterium]